MWNLTFLSGRVIKNSYWIQLIKLFVSYFPGVWLISRKSVFKKRKKEKKNTVMCRRVKNQTNESACPPVILVVNLTNYWLIKEPEWMNQWIQRICVSHNPPTNWQTNNQSTHPIHLFVYWSISQSIFTHAINKSTNLHSRYQAIIWTLSQLVSQLVSQSVSQSLSHSLTHSLNLHSLKQ